jgi:EAL and modified HD-GYP domain-containing signal transduction protein
VLEAEILGHVALGYSAFIDRNRAVTATRLTVFPLRPDMPLDARELLQAVASVWPANGGRVSLNVTSESLLQDLLQTSPSANLMVEVPAFMAADPVNTASIVALHAHGTTLMLKGRPLKDLPREVLPCFKQSIIDLSDDRRVAIADVAPAGVSRTIPHVLAGINTAADMDSAFSRGAVAVLGWPLGDEVTERPKGGRAPPTPIDLQTVVELIRQIKGNR